jgi:hypothetical protein
MKPEILKKTEKIASAVYLVTSFFDEKEPLKWRLRTLSSNLLSSSLLIKDNPPSLNDKAVIDVQNNLLEMDSLFLIAKNSGLVSANNQEILSSEFQKFVASISGTTQNLEDSRKGLLSKDFFGSSVSRSNYFPEIKTSSNQEIIKDKTDETPVIDKGHRPNEPKQLKEYSVVAVKKNSRQSTIISLLKRKKEIMIKDVSPLINGCSEKTIQRELMAMVQNGTLRKIGEKRWSRYSLA